MSYNRILFACLSAICCIAASAQDADQQKMDSFSAKFISAIRTQEKQQAQLITDKSVYAAGENIWFRAFLLNAVSQRISSKNKFLFADLVNDKDSVIKTVILDAANRQLSSRIYLPDSIPAGYYWLRAYTRQMAEGDASGICVKPVYVFGKTDYNDLTRSKKVLPKKDSLPTIIFYPEGGSIITGINSTVALHCIMNGSPVSINGNVKDNSDKVVTPFSTNKNGLGKFSFEPSGFKKYKAVINWNGKDISFPLPEFNFYSGQISITKEVSVYKLRVLLGDSVYSKNFASYIIGVSKDSIFFAAIGKGQYEIVVPEQKFPGGIATFYLFNKHFDLLSERSVYAHGNNLNVQVTTDKNIYGVRDKVALNISISDAGLHPVPSLVTISVADTAFSALQEQSPDIIYDPGNADNIFLTRHEHLSYEDADLLMLVRHNSFDAQKKDNFPSLPDDADSLLYIRGIVVNGKNEPVANKSLTLMSGSDNYVLHTDTTDNKGRFCFPLEYYADSTQFMIDAGNGKGHADNTRILPDNFIYPTLKTPASLKQFYGPEPKQAKQHFNKYYNEALAEWGGQQLPPVTVKDEKKNLTYDVSKRVSNSSAILTSRDLNERNSVGNAVLNVAGMHKQQGFLVFGGPTSFSGVEAGSEPIVVVEGSQVSLNVGSMDESSPVLSYLNSLNPKDIDFIEVLKGPEGASYGIRGGHGVILINLLNKRREIGAGENDVKVYYAKGVTTPVLFSNADYHAKGSKKDILTDHRSTLFWNGSYLTGQELNEPINFYTNDIPSTYSVTITGMTIHGDIIYKTISFQTGKTGK